MPDENGGLVDRSVGRRKADALKTVLAWAGVVAIAVSGLTGTVAILAADRAADLATADHEQVQLVQRATWRICERAILDRALVHAALLPHPVRQETPPERDARRAFRRLIELQNPIVNCDPNLRGRPAYPLDSAAQRAYVEKWRRGELEPLPEPPGGSGLTLEE